MKTLLYSFPIVLIITFQLYAQQFQLEWELPLNSDYVYYVGDIDGDGIGEFVDRGSGTIHSGADGSIKYTIDFTIDGNTPLLRWNTQLVEIDFNNNGVKDFYSQYQPDSSNAALYAIIIFDPSSNEIIFEHNYEHPDRAFINWVGDFDNDGILEITVDINYSPSSGLTKVYSTGVMLSSIDDNKKLIPKYFNLSQNYPNPFNPSTTIEYDITSPGVVNLSIFDITGQLIKTIVNEYQNAGTYKVYWNGVNTRGEKISSDRYFYNLKVDDNQITKKMVFLK